ncbi:DUF7513 family protein [Haloprofundus salinisoli]|uniref:DUF7513 family protein n=1 Tax=Haloprofundus salinisoli TaxID=2876193 RepID=UPI001CCEBACE|nr:hypothetical protein [Haloprofundus salinisoli]
MSDRRSQRDARADGGGALRKLLAGWTFRTSTPSYDVGDELVAYVTGVDGDAPVVRVGDTVLRLTKTADDVGLAPDGDLLDRKVRLRVDSFDDAAHQGTAELLAVSDESGATF